MSKIQFIGQTFNLDLNLTHNTVATTHESVKMLRVIFRILIIGSSHVGLFFNKIKEISISFQISANERS